MAWSKLLLPLTPLYAGLVRARAAAYQRGWITSWRLPVPVVSVGNLTFGGTGKTPTVMALVRDLVRRGHHPAVLSRGYRRSERVWGSVVLLGPETQEQAERCGDEPLEMARRLPGVPIVVNADRFSGGKEAIRHGADILVLDDGFQHLRLQRDLDLVLVDAGDPWGGDHLPPRGRLREPVTALRRASAVLISKLPVADEFRLAMLRRRIAEIAPDLPVLASSLQAYRVRTPDGGRPAEVLQGCRVLAFAGVGRPAGFQQLLAGRGAEVVRTCWFRDHHQYQQHEVEQLLATARDLGAVPVTTAKDAVKLPTGTPVWVVEVRVVPHTGSWDELWSLLPARKHAPAPLDPA